MNLNFSLFLVRASNPNIAHNPARTKGMNVQSPHFLLTITPPINGFFRFLWRVVGRRKNHPIGSIYHLYTTYIPCLRLGAPYNPYHLSPGTWKIHLNPSPSPKWMPFLDWFVGPGTQKHPDESLNNRPLTKKNIPKHKWSAKSLSRHNLDLQKMHGKKSSPNGGWMVGFWGLKFHTNLEDSDTVFSVEKHQDFLQETTSSKVWPYNP